MQSSVGNPQIYEDGDQRTSKQTDSNPRRYDEGQHHAHVDLDSKDERSLANRLAAASKHSRMNESTNPASDPEQDPLGPARAHGNEPSRGAQIDAELKREEEELLRNKGKA
ncbi:hypothetical protein BV22DRAFT_1073139 [Leucogyrophana mollusca]|uniref:Uncharacterized protein n=1 Tax=Leucogyrophana mollusca TaxID=85980 RepID=A0ACB8B5N0_9AGAM|nr:hypothetical protein BV22DRAFT_1073139 [Leucogyrophana mollusca]